MPEHLLALLNDTYRFALMFGDFVQMEPGLVKSALPFCPTATQLYRQYARNLPCVVRVLGGDQQWPSCLCTLSGHTDLVPDVVFSPNGAFLASASQDKTVRVWDTATGICMAILEGHTSWVGTITFSPDGTRLVSGSIDQTVRV